MTAADRSRFLVHTMALPGRDVLGALQLASELGVAGIELICQEDYSCAISPRAGAAEVRMIARQTADLGVVVGAVTPYTRGLDALDASVRGTAIDELERIGYLSAELGCPRIRVLGGDIWPLHDAGAAHNRLVESCLELGVRLLDAGVELNIENHPGTLAIGAQETVSIVGAVDAPNVGIIFDPVNLVREGLESPTDGWSIQRPWVRHIHVKDVLTGPEIRYVPTVVGEGSIDWRELVNLFDGDAYEGYLSLEYETRWHPEVMPPPEIGLEKSLRAFDQIAGSR